MAAGCGSGARSGPGAGSGSGPGAENPSGPTITIGSTNFYEQSIVAYLYADVLRHAGFHTVLHPDLGARAQVEPALASGTLDLYPDYAGTLLLSLVPRDARQATSTSSAVALLRKALAPKGATVLNPTPALDVTTFAVTQETASKYDLTTLSSLVPVASQLVLGGSPQCPRQATCLEGLESRYGMHFKGFSPTDQSGPVTVAELKNGGVQVAELFSTDAEAAVDKFVQLTDDKHLEPADHIVPVIRNSADTSVAQGALDALSARLTTAQLTELDLEVSIDHQDVSLVASRWLERQGLT